MQLHSHILSGISYQILLLYQKQHFMNGISIILWKKKHVKMHYVCFRLGNTKKTFMYVTIKKKIATLIMSQINLRQKVF